MAITSAADKIMSNDDYLSAVKQFGKELANNMANSSFFDVSPETIALVESNSMSNSGGENSATSPYVTQEGNPLNKDYNNITGGVSFSDDPGKWLMGGVDNGNKYSGAAMPIYNAATSIFKNYMAYQGLQETKKNNAAKLAMAEEGLERQRITQGNKIAQARRYQQIGMGNSNSMAGTVATVSRNPYSTYGKYIG